jgi:glutamate receptor, ionotropic, invertebrate
LNEPLRAIIITNPRKFVYRIYYNQATSSNEGKLKLVNWFDGNNLGLFTEPILSRVKNIYENFHERSFVVPVIHVREESFPQQPKLSINQSVPQLPTYFQSPPWIFINYIDSNSTDVFIDQSQMCGNDNEEMFSVTGRDDSLLKILAEKMNFKFKYVDVARMCSAENNTQPGELGLRMIQERVRRKM